MSNIYEYKGNHYVLLGYGIIKENGKEINAVIYTHKETTVEGNKLPYIRKKDDFCQKFKQVIPAFNRVSYD